MERNHRSYKTVRCVHTMACVTGSLWMKGYGFNILYEGVFGGLTASTRSSRSKLLKHKLALLAGLSIKSYLRATHATRAVTTFALAHQVQSHEEIAQQMHEQRTAIKCTHDAKHQHFELHINYSQWFPLDNTLCKAWNPVSR